MSRKITMETNVMMKEIRQLISEGKTVTITAKGHSMNPFIRHLKDQVTLGPWRNEDIRKGSAVLVLTDKGDYVLHRIVKRTGNALTLEGDGNVGLNENSCTDKVIGILYSVTRNGRIYPTDGFVWRTYSLLWSIIRPIKRYPLHIWRRLQRHS